MPSFVWTERGIVSLATGYWLLATGILSSGCSPTYVLQAGYEEAKILWSRQPIEEILQREDLDAPTREKLRLVLRVRQFAEQELGFRVDGSYSSLAQVKQPPIAHVLTAARRLVKLEHKAGNIFRMNVVPDLFSLILDPQVFSG